VSKFQTTQASMMTSTVSGSVSNRLFVHKVPGWNEQYLAQLLNMPVPVYKERPLPVTSSRW